MVFKILLNNAKINIGYIHKID